MGNSPFAARELVVYPPHGVGKVIKISKMTMDKTPLELLVIEFERDKMTLSIPVPKLISAGLRPLSEDLVVNKAMETLRSRAKVKRGMWSRRSQEYNTKLNSGDLISIAQVARDLFRPQRKHEQSYSERRLYEMARDRIAQELAAIDKIDESSAQQRVEDTLNEAYPPPPNPDKPDKPDKTEKTE